MTQYTILTADELQSIADEYALGQLQSFTVLEGGSQNTNYRLQTSEGRFVLTVSEQHPAAEVEQLVHLLEHLRTNGFATSRAIPNRNAEFVGNWDAKPIMVKQYLDGIIIEDMSPDLLEQLGTALAQLHRIPAPGFLPNKLGYGIEYFHEVKTYAPGSDYQHWLERQQHYLAPYLAMDLPKCLIHSDVFDNNIVVAADESHLNIIDFEEAAYYYRLFDLGIAIVGVCRHGQRINLDKAQHLLHGYQSQERLLSTEQEALQAFVVYAATAMSFWRHRNFNYTIPTPTKFNHYQALQNVAKHARALPEGSLLFR